MTFKLNSPRYALMVEVLLISLILTLIPFYHSYAVTPISPSYLFAIPIPSEQPRIELYFEDHSTNETGFIVERSTTDSFTVTSVVASLAPNTITWNDLDVSFDILYFYRVKAISGNNSSSWSNTAPVRISHPPASNGFFVRPVLFVPKNRIPDAQYETKLQTVMQLIQQFYAVNLYKQGLGYTPFNLEMNPDGRPKVYLVRGQYDDSYYIPQDMTAYQNAHAGDAKIHQELGQIFDFNRELAAVIADIEWYDPAGKIEVGPWTGGRWWSQDKPMAKGGVSLVGDIMPYAGTTVSNQLSLFCNKTIDTRIGNTQIGYNAEKYLGGYAHETGHAFGAQHSPLAIDLMGMGNYMFSRPFVSCIATYDVATISNKFSLLFANSALFKQIINYTDNVNPTLQVNTPDFIQAETSIPITLKIDDEGGSGLGFLAIYYEGVMFDAIDLRGKGNSFTTTYQLHPTKPLLGDACITSPGSCMIGFYLLDDASNRIEVTHKFNITGGNPPPVPPPPTIDSNEIVYIEDGFPPGTTSYNQNWVWVKDIKASGEKSIYFADKSGDIDKTFFLDSPTKLTLNKGDLLTMYVYIPAGDSIEAVGFRWGNGPGSWSTTAYWGADKIITWNGKPASVRIGDLPQKGGWVKLSVNVEALNLQNQQINGFEFTAFGSGHVFVDRIGKLPVSPTILTLPTPTTTPPSTPTPSPSPLSIPTPSPTPPPSPTATLTPSPTPTNVIVPIDNTQPILSNISTSNITAQSAVISWTTNEPASSQVSYSTDGSFSSTLPQNPILLINHSMLISNLIPNNTYNYRVISIDGAGNTSISSGKTFSTLPIVDNQAPNTITNLSVREINQNSMMLSWTSPSDPPSGSQTALYDIRYSTAPLNSSNWEVANQATGEPTPVIQGINQSYILPGLSPATTYYIGIKSHDSAIPTNISLISNLVAQATLPTSNTNNGTNNNGGSGGITNTTPIDTTPPEKPSSFRVTESSNQIAISWVNPTDSDFVRVILLKKEGLAPISVTDGTKIYEGRGKEFTDTNVAKGKQYYYALYAFDQNINYSQPATGFLYLNNIIGNQTITQSISEPTSSPNTDVHIPSAKFKIGDNIQALYQINVRGTPGGYKITTISKNLQVKIIGGPITQGDFTWWQIDYGNGVLGYSAEGTDTNPYFTKVTSTKLENIAKGNIIKINVSSLKVRLSPNGDKIKTVYKNRQGTIIGGPVVVGGYTWWQIKYNAGLMGWSAEGDSKMQYIIKI